jgi:Antitoxin VbhA
VNDLAVEPKPRITAVEMEQRREAMRQAAAHNRIEGQFPTPEGTATFDAFIRGDIERHEILLRLNAIHRHP